MKSFIRFSSFLLGGALLMLFPVVIVTATFSGPSVSPPGGGGAIQVDPGIPSTIWPVLKIVPVDDPLTVPDPDYGAITIGKWQTTNTGLPLGTTSTPPTVAVPIDTLFGGTGCSESAPAGVRGCLGAAASGANSDITSLSPTGDLLLNPSGAVMIRTGSLPLPPTGPPPALPVVLAVGDIGGTIPFLVNSAGNITRINGVTYSWPLTQGAPTTFLSNDGLGGLTWSTGGLGGGGSIGGWTEDVPNNWVYTTTPGRLVGVGTATPTEKLDVAGNIKLTGDIKLNNQLFVYSRGSSGDSFFAGYLAGNTAVTGGRNTGVGTHALASLTSGSNNTAAGNAALSANTIGGNNVAIGESALSDNISGSNNTAVGRAALISSSGNGNVGVGNGSGDTNITGSNNTFVGTQADATLPNLTNATAIGYNAKVSQSDSIILGQVIPATKVGIGTTAPSALLSVGPNAFQVNGAGDIITIRGVTYSWPTTPGVPGSVLTNAGPPGGVLSWTVPAGGGGGLPNGWFENTVTNSIYPITASRLVGIGTTNPGTKLTVAPSGAGTTFAIRDTADLANVFTIDDTGTVTAGSVPWARLTAFPNTVPAPNPCPAGQFVSAIGPTITCSAPGAASGGWTEDIPGNKVYLITAGRNVGIGISSPLAKLHVTGGSVGAIIEGSVVIGPSSTSASSKLNVVGLVESIGTLPACAGTGTCGFKFPDGTIQTTAAGGLSGAGTASKIAKWTGASTLGDSNIYEDATGNIAIGASSAGPFSSKLQVNGNILVQSGGSTITPAGGSIASVFATYGSGSGTAAGYGAVTGIISGGASTNSALYGYNNGGVASGLIVEQDGTGDIARFQNSGGTGGVISNAGNLGIGAAFATPPTAKVEVVNNTDDTIRLTKTAGVAGSVNFYTAIPSSSMTGDVACTSTGGVTGALASGKCLAQWNSSGTLIACGSPGGASARVLCSGFGN